MIGQVNMQGFMKSLLLKRLESSFFAFKNTIRRFKESYEKFLSMYNQGTVYISKKYDVYELLTNEDDEKLMELVADGEIEKYESAEFKENLKEDLEKDLNILNEMYQSTERLGNKDCKLEYFLENLRKNKILKDSKIIIFTESKETAEYLTRNIEKNLNKEVICYTGSSNTSKKDVIIANFDPNFKGKKEDRYNILNKIQAFHNTLGEDFKYLSDDEEIDSYGLYDKLMASLENEEETMGESELEYLSLIRNIRDEDEELYLKIKNLPKKSKSSREYRETFIEPSTISFLKRGENKRIYITNRNLEAKELAFFDAVKYFKCKVDEPRQEIDNEFYQLLAINKATFAQTSETKKTEEIKKAGKSREIQKIIDGLRNYKKFNESEEKKLEKIIEIFEVGKLSKNYVKNILQECKKVFETANPHRILEVFYETIPEEYKGVTQKRVDKRGHKIEVLLSEYLI